MIQQIAEQFRKDLGLRGKAGVVTIWDGKATGWSNKLRNPERFKPGSIAVTEGGDMYRAVGGNDYDGADEWVTTG